MTKSVLISGLFVIALLVTSCVSNDIEVRDNRSVVPASTSLYPERPAPSENRDMLRVKIVMISTDVESQGFSQSVCQGISGGFSSPDVKVVEKGAHDFLLEVRPRLMLFDQTGENFIYEGEVSLSLKDAARSRMYASKTLHWKGSREFGKETAIRKMVDQIVTGATDWVDGTLKGIASQDYVSTLITVQLPKGLWETLRGSRDHTADQGRVLEASREIGKLPGLLQYELRELDVAKGIATFRVVYQRKEYPAGIVNAIGDALNHSALTK